MAVAKIKDVVVSDTACFVQYETGTEKMYPVDKVPKTVLTWLEKNQAIEETVEEPEPVDEKPEAVEVVEETVEEVEAVEEAVEETVDPEPKTPEPVTLQSLEGLESVPTAALFGEIGRRLLRVGAFAILALVTAVRTWLGLLVPIVQGVAGYIYIRARDDFPYWLRSQWLKFLTILELTFFRIRIAWR